MPEPQTELQDRTAVEDLALGTAYEPLPGAGLLPSSEYGDTATDVQSLAENAAIIRPSLPPQRQEWFSEVLRELIPVLADILRNRMYAYDPETVTEGRNVLQFIREELFAGDYNGETGGIDFPEASSEDIATDDRKFFEEEQETGKLARIDAGPDSNRISHTALRFIAALTEYALKYHPICRDPRENVPEDVEGAEDLSDLSQYHQGNRTSKLRVLVNSAFDGPDRGSIAGVTIALRRILGQRQVSSTESNGEGVQMADRQFGRPLILLGFDTDEWSETERRDTKQRSLRAIDALAHVSQVGLYPAPDLVREWREYHVEFYECHLAGNFCSDSTSSQGVMNSGRSPQSAVLQEQLRQEDQEASDTGIPPKQGYEVLQEGPFSPGSGVAAVLSTVTEETWWEYDDLMNHKKIQTFQGQGMEEPGASRQSVRVWVKRLADHDLLDLRGGNHGGKARFQLTPLGVAAKSCVNTETLEFKHPAQETLESVFEARTASDEDEENTESIHPVTATPHGDESLVYLRASGNRNHGEGVRRQAPDAAASPPVGSAPHGRGAASARNRLTAAVGPAGIGAEDWIADTGQAEKAGYVQLLSGPGGVLGPEAMHARYLSGKHVDGVTVVDTDLQEFEDGRVAYLSYLEDSVLTVAQWGGPLPTLIRCIAALLDDRAWSNLLRPSAVEEMLDQIPEKYEQAAEDVIHLGFQLGWVTEDDLDEYESWRSRWRAVRDVLLERLRELTSMEDDDPDYTDKWTDLCEDAHGLLAATTHLYKALGKDVTITVRFPDGEGPVRNENVRSRFLSFCEHTVPKHATYKGRSVYRALLESDEEKLKRQLPITDVLDVSDSTADMTASWVFAGEHLSKLTENIRQRLNSLKARESAPSLSLEIPVLSGSSLSSVKRLVQTYLEQAEHGPRADAELRGLVRSLAGVIADANHQVNPYSIGEILYRVRHESLTSGKQRVTRREIEEAIAHLPAAEILPDVQQGSETLSEIVRVLLASSRPLRQAEIRPFLSVARKRRAFNRAVDQLQSVGIVSKDEHGRWIATICPSWSPATAALESTESSREEQSSSIHTAPELGNAMTLAPPDITKTGPSRSATSGGARRPPSRPSSREFGPPDIPPGRPPWAEDQLPEDRVHQRQPVVDIRKRTTHTYGSTVYSVARQYGYSDCDAEEIAATVTGDCTLGNVPSEIERWRPLLVAHFGTFGESKREELVAQIGRRVPGADATLSRFIDSEYDVASTTTVASERAVRRGR